MKHATPFFLLALSITGLSAQPVLDFSNTGTIPGDAFTYNACPWEDPGSAGANQTWDLTALTSDSLIYIFFADPDTTPDAAAFPDATIAAGNDSGYAYSQFDAAGGWFHGLGITGTSPIVYSDPMQWVAYPATYGSAWTDDFHAEFTIMGFNIVRDGSITADCDAYGTLELPWGTLTDVLRTTYVEDYTDVNAFITITYHREYTYFMQAGTHYPIVHLFSFTTTILGNSNTITGSQWLVAGSVDIVDGPAAAPSINAWLDPSVDAINVDLILDPNAGPTVIELIDASGGIVARRSLGGMGGHRTERIGTGALARGLYMVRVSTNAGRASRRIVVL